MNNPESEKQTVKPGDVFVLFGVRLTIVEIADGEAYYICRAGESVTSRVAPLDYFELNLALGLLERWEDPPPWLGTIQ